MTGLSSSRCGPGRLVAPCRAQGSTCLHPSQGRTTHTVGCSRHFQRSCYCASPWCQPARCQPWELPAAGPALAQGRPLGVQLASESRTRNLGTLFPCPLLHSLLSSCASTKVPLPVWFTNPSRPSFAVYNLVSLLCQWHTAPRAHPPCCLCRRKCWCQHARLPSL